MHSTYIGELVRMIGQNILRMTAGRDRFPSRRVQYIVASNSNSIYTGFVPCICCAEGHNFNYNSRYLIIREKGLFSLRVWIFES
jgi:hypothetical protein